MAVAGREGHEGAVDCPVDVHDTFDVSLVATECVALICVLLLALFLALQLFMGCVSFLQNVHL